NDEGWGRGRRPVINITWEDALAYAQWLSERTGENYRLPTEAEWEYAARAGTQTPRFWPEAKEGEPEPACRYANVFDKRHKSQIFDNLYPESLSDKTNSSIRNIIDKIGVFDCDDDFPYTAPVGQFVANDWQLHDMLGNVWEWNQDCYIDSYEGAPTDGSPREANDGSECSRRVLRGGSWLDVPLGVRSAARFWGTPVVRNNDIGFRLARTL
ncbi:MAG: formylglycine-generating enzyme family protein, partial [Gammaproteobacteria bacterium]|nr:formylglycine-generating enzyme family protein [Gammaproteobacteria bacterium]